MTTVRGIQAADKSQWAPLFVAYGVFYRTAFTDEIVDAVFEKLVSDSRDVEGLVALDGDRVIGFALVRELYDTFVAGPSYFLDDLFVDPSARGSGAATALITAASEIAASRGANSMRWFTEENNETAQRVYNKIATRKPWFTYEMEF